MAKIPVSILSGFLGSGKTTLLAQILQDNAYKNSAIIINEMGEVGLDDRILASQISFVAENMVLLKSGCVCCNKREDLIKQLKEILEDFEAKGKQLDQVIVETTGLANLTPILFSIRSDVFLESHFEVGTIISCIDALNAKLHLQEEICKNQIAFSDIAILTKLDISTNDTKDITNALLSINPYLKIYPKDTLPSNVFQRTQHIKTPKITDNYGVDSTKNSIEWNAFGVSLSFLLYKYGEQILRIKGLIDIGEEYLVSIDGAMHILHTPRHIPKNMPSTQDKSDAFIVFITKGLQKQHIIESFYAFCK